MKQNNTIALDIGGTNIKMAVIHDGVIAKTSTIPSYSEGRLQDRLADIEQELTRLTEGDFQNYHGMGVALPCLVNPKTKRATEIYAKFEDAPSLDLEQWSLEKFGLPIAMEQDSRASLLGEAHYGVAQGDEDILLIIMGTGVGTAVMSNGQLLTSKGGSIGSLGSHIIIEQHGRKCTCNSAGCLEAYTSGWALPGIVRDQEGFEQSLLAKVDHIDFYQLQQAVEQQDEVAISALKVVTTAMRAGIISLIHAYDSSTIVMSGGPLNMGELFTKPVFDHIEDCLWGTNKKVELKISENPSLSVLMGLHYLCLKEIEE